MIEWDPAFRRDLDLTNWIESDLRKEFTHLLADHVDLAVGKGYLSLTEQFLRHVDQNAIPLILMAAREERARLYLIYEITGLVDDAVEQELEELAGDLTARSRITCERCGDPGQPQIIRGGIDAHKILCPTCQRMYDDAIFFDHAIPSMVRVIRDYVAGYQGSFADLDKDIVDAFSLPRLPKTGRRRTRAMLKRVWVEVCLSVLKPDIKRWWHDG
ncbi:hypothetical protein ASG42_11265 [Rhizobium sp. Leaf391]|uniref:hypothetical protein n=1 Tax=Rhizobium sp. Leaf391 TaxID=1736360 RepID=UPI0007128754|nr:hypothetical protein [Rhizobium sp. Leaf391]KQS91063.1 hypothetical protein ASG42_11265 [Rhizobium sp. Leaf391]